MLPANTPDVAIHLGTVRGRDDKVEEQLEKAMGFDETLMDSEQQTMAGMVRKTIAPTANLGTTAGERAKQMLVQAAKRRGDGLRLGKTLGEGGMGVVYSARQAELGRHVAVKTLRKEIRSGEAIASMLREAWVTGMLEHPNIVPIYYVDTDEKGDPLIVMKQIEGVSWSSLMTDAKTVRERYDAGDLFEWNMSVLDKVVNAIRYAHSRGVVHRDLKPDNVMLGEFGEVYLVDWGIAVSLHDKGETLLPLAAEVSQAAGTPAYMAPEMLTGPLDERTDVYLLGALLYQVLADRPPHVAESLPKIVKSIRESTPSFPSQVPEGLREICCKAMAASPSDRYASASEFRHAIKTFMEHRSSLRLSSRAQQNYDKMRDIALEGGHPEDMLALFGECRFGFQSALEAWPENPQAVQGMFRATEMMAEVELKRGDPRVASRLLQELDEPSESLLARVQEEVTKLDEVDERMARLDQALDKGVGGRARVYILTALGMVWIGFELWGELSGNIKHASHALMAGGSIAFLFVLLVLLFFSRSSLEKTVLNRQFAGGFVALLGSQALISLVADPIGLAPWQAQILWMLIWAAIATMVALSVEPRVWGFAIACILSVVLSAIHPEYRIYAMAATTAVAVANGAVIWWPRNDGEVGIERSDLESS